MTLRMIEREKFNEGKASSLVSSVENLIKNLNLPLEEACSVLGSSVQQYEEAKKIIDK